MRSIRLLGALVAATALVALAGPAGAGAVVITVEVDPTSGGPGTEIAVTGTCEDPPGTACTGVIAIALLDATATVVAETSTETGGGPDIEYDTVIVVPGTATAGTYTVRAEALDAVTQEVLASTEESFTVPESGPAPTTPPMAEPAAPEPVAPGPAAPPAPRPVVAAPRVTG